MHLHSSAGPINVVVLNQDKELSSLIPTKCHHPSSLPSTHDSDMDTAPITDTTLTNPPSSGIVTDENTSTIESDFTRMTEDVPSQVSPASSPSTGMVTRRMRRQAELEDVGKREKDGDVGSDQQEGRSTHSEEQAMEIDRVSYCVCVCVLILSVFVHTYAWDVYELLENYIFHFDFYPVVHSFSKACSSGG